MERSHGEHHEAVERVVMAGRARRKVVPTETQIVVAALALIDAGGPAAASIPRIAAAVNVAPTTVYRLFPNRAAVERAIIEQLLGTILGSAPAFADRPWQDGVEALALAFRCCLTDHPGAAPLVTTGPMNGPNALRYRERLLTLLEAGGLDAGNAARAAYVLMVFILGSIAREAADGPHLGPLPPEEQRIAARRPQFDAIPAGTFPRAAAAGEVMAAGVGAEQFRWGLRRVLAGVAGPQLEDEPRLE
jgi:AcrR family transcriptional regulator